MRISPGSLRRVAAQCLEGAGLRLRMRLPGAGWLLAGNSLHRQWCHPYREEAYQAPLFRLPTSVVFLRRPGTNITSVVQHKHVTCRSPDADFCSGPTTDLVSQNAFTLEPELRKTFSLLAEPPGRRKNLCGRTRALRGASGVSRPRSPFVAQHSAIEF